MSSLSSRSRRRPAPRRRKRLSAAAAAASSSRRPAVLPPSAGDLEEMDISDGEEVDVLQAKPPLSDLFLTSEIQTTPSEEPNQVTIADILARMDERDPRRRLLGEARFSCDCTGKSFSTDSD